MVYVVVAVLCAPALAYSGRDIAKATGMGETFVGTTLLAVSYTPAALLSSVDAGQAVAGVGAILLLVAYAGTLFAVWSVRP